MVQETYVDECLQRMRDWMQLRGLKANTVSTYAGCARRFVEKVAKLLEAISDKDVQDYMLGLVGRKRT